MAQTIARTNGKRASDLSDEEDVGNIISFEHVNVTVPDPIKATTGIRSRRCLSISVSIWSGLSGNPGRGGQYIKGCYARRGRLVIIDLFGHRVATKTVRLLLVRPCQLAGNAVTDWQSPLATHTSVPSEAIASARSSL